MKILNLYAGIGGNRKHWGTEHEVVAVEMDPQIAQIYQNNFPNDKVVVCDAHKLLTVCWDMIKHFDFIWTSPPCPSHSVVNAFLNVQGCIRYPDMKLYEEIIFLKHFFKGRWVVENVRSYYEPMILPYEAERHYFWSNFMISNKKRSESINITNTSQDYRIDQDEHIKMLEEYHGFDLSQYKLPKRKRYKLLANCVKPKLGLYIFEQAFKEEQKTLSF